MRLTSSLTGFNFEIINGVSGKNVPAKALSGVRLSTKGICFLISIADGTYRSSKMVKVKMELLAAGVDI